jgi:hypothetical protein
MLSIFDLGGDGDGKAVADAVAESRAGDPE